MRQNKTIIIFLLAVLLLSIHDANATRSTNWEAILKHIQEIKGGALWGKAQCKKGKDDDDKYYDDDDKYDDDANGDDNYSSDDDDDSSEIPLDGGLSFLAAAGAGLGIKKLRDNRAKKKSGNKEK